METIDCPSSPKKNDGSFIQMTGAFTRSGAEGADPSQGVLASFSARNLDAVGDRIEASYTWLGGGGNNSPQSLTFGFFSGNAISTNAQTGISDDWTGFYPILYHPSQRRHIRRWRVAAVRWRRNLVCPHTEYSHGVCH